MSARAIPLPPSDPSPPKRQRLESLKTPTTGRLASLRKDQALQTKQSAKGRQCPNPECLNKDVGEEDGQIVCRGCGTVISDANIVAELQFAETSGGGHLMIGQHVGSDQAHARSSMVGLRNAGGMDSRDVTHANGRRFINQIGAALTIDPGLQVSGMNVFKLAAANNFIQGRTTQSVAAVSLYIASRLLDDGSKWMLIDFSDILMLNVFKLGQIYKDLVEEIRLNGAGKTVRPYVPEKLIERFAERLELGTDKFYVQNDAVRILQRMKRDWITPGRRPAGVCGAALLIAARMHNYRRSVREMEYVAKVGAPTLIKRLEEFARTESSGLTIEEFRTITLEHDTDPPAFYEQNPGTGRKKRKRQLVDVDDDGDTDTESQHGTQKSPTAMNEQLPTPVNTHQKTQTGSQSMPPPPVPNAASSKAAPPAKKKRGRPPKGSSSARLAAAASSDMPEDPDIRTAMSSPSSFDHASALTQVLDADAAGPSQPTEQTPAARRPIALTEDISDSEFGIDPEISGCLLTPRETEIKTRIWTHENRDWIRAEHAKQLKQRLAEENGTLPKVKRRVRRRTRMGDMAAYRRESTGSGGDGEDAEGDDNDRMPARSYTEAVTKMMKKRAYSKKINYEALHKYYGPPSSKSNSTSGDRRESASAAGDADGREGALRASESPGPYTAGEFQAAQSNIRSEAASETNGSGRRPEPGPASAAPPDDIQAIAQEEEEERHMLDPANIMVDHDVPDVDEDDVEDEPGDYFGGEDDENASEEDDENVGDDDDYD